MATRRGRRRSSPDLIALRQLSSEQVQAVAHDNGVFQTGAVKVRKYLLATYDKVPGWLKDNPHIAGGYRVHFSWRLCVRSMFRLHNETLNVWTHLIGFFIFLFLLFSMMLTVSPYGFDYLHMDQRIKLSAENLSRYRQHVSNMVDSIRIRIPTWVDLSNNIIELSRDIGDHLQPTADSRAAAYLANFKEALTTIKHAVGGFCETCSVGDIDRMRRSLSDSVDHVFESLANVPHAPSHAVEVVRHRLQEIASFLRSIPSEGTVPEFPDMVPDAIVFLSKWPLAVFIGAAMSCLLFSTIFHLFYCRSEQACILLQQLDYAGICILIAGSMVPAIYYGFYCSRIIRTMYIVGGISLPLIAFFLCMSKYLSGHRHRHVRAAVFAVAGLANLIPLCHMLAINAGEQRIMLLLCGGGACYIIGAIFYSTQIPESIFPGKFDIWFHSHTIFHVFVVIAALMHYAALMRFFQWRMLNTCPTYS
uniref:Uncharacterized protein n=1 Tax=Spongospora subterranea TaxID=70186 RepID=A0A0H5R6G9_9EUKA|eukprot:CRZ09728.1 hypothetical protein [Spongospora subterranea]